MKGPVPDSEHIVPIGKAYVARKGKDVTIVSYSLMMHRGAGGSGKTQKIPMEFRLKSSTCGRSAKLTKRLFSSPCAKPSAWS